MARLRVGVHVILCTACINKRFFALVWFLFQSVLFHSLGLFCGFVAFSAFTIVSVNFEISILLLLPWLISFLIICFYSSGLVA